MRDDSSRPVIFLAFANEKIDGAAYLRNLSAESRRLREVLEKAVRAGLCDVVERSNTTAADIFSVFQDPQYRDRIAVFHYGGHANGYQLLLESAQGEPAAADAGGLAAFLAQQRGLQLMVLNGCSTRQQTQGLLEANVPAVISTSRDIDDQIATDFAAQFYQGLAGGATIQTAYKEAQAAAQTAAGGDTRTLFSGARKKGPDDVAPDSWPWGLYLREGCEAADQWNLPKAVNNPLFGLPELPQQDLPDSPYRHLNWFTHRDAEIFFGRGHQIRELFDRLTAAHTAPIMLFYGQSGVGKSSVLDAGLIPRLAQDFEVRYVRRDDLGLLAALQGAITGTSEADSRAPTQQANTEKLGKQVVELLDEMRVADETAVAGAIAGKREQMLSALQTIFSEPGHYLRDTANRLLETLGPTPAKTSSSQATAKAWRQTEDELGKPLIVFLDQVEELYTHPSTVAGDELEEFLEALESIFSNPDQRPQGRLVMGFRKEWLAELEAQLVAHGLPRTKLFLEPLDQRGIIEVIEGPTYSTRLREQYRLSIEPKLAGIIADDLLADRDSAIAPTLQILLTKMWEKAVEENSEAPQFTKSMYDDLEREGILLRDFLKQQIVKLRHSHPEAVNSGLLLDLLASHTTAMGTAGQCELEELQQRYKHLGDKLPELLQRCQDLHLLTVATGINNSNGKVTRLAHDTLAPLVREQFDISDLPGQRAKRILDNRSVDWKSEKTGTPLDETDLAIVEQGLNGTREPGKTEQLLLSASREQRALRQRQRQRRRAFNRLAVGAIIAAGLFSVYQWQQADKQRALAVQNEKMLLGQLHRKDPVLGRLIAREVTGRQKGWTAIAADLHSYRVPKIFFSPSKAATAIVKEVAFGSKESFATGNNANEVWLWRPDENDSMQSLLVDTHDAFLWDVEFSLDGHRLASADNSGIVKIWTVEPTGPPSLSHTLSHSNEGSALRVRMSRNGSVAAVLTENVKGTQVVLWRLSGAQQQRDLIEDPELENGNITSLALNPNGTELLLGYSSGAVWLKHLSQAATPHIEKLEPENTPAAQEQADSVQHVAFDDNGTSMASVSATGIVNLWNQSTAASDSQTTELGFEPVALSLHNDRIFVAGELHVYVSNTSALEDQSFSFFPEFFEAPLWDADFDGEQFITALEGHNEVSVWPLKTRFEPRVLTPTDKPCPDQRAVNMSYLPDDSLLVAYEGGTVRLWSSLVLNNQGGKPGRSDAKAKAIQSAPQPGNCESNKAPPFPTPLTAMTASDDGKRYAVAFLDGRIITGGIESSHSKTVKQQNFTSSTSPSNNSGTSKSRAKTCGFPFIEATDSNSENNELGNAIWSLVFDPGAGQLLVGHQDGRVRTLNLSTRSWTEVGTHEEAICAVDWAPDGTTLASGSLDGKLKIWPVTQGGTAASPTELDHKSAVYTAAFDAGSKRIVTGSEDSTVRVWDLEDLEKNKPVELRGHFNTVNTAAFSPSGDWVVHGGDDKLLGINCLKPTGGGWAPPCEPDTKMVLLASSSNETTDEKVRALAVAHKLPQFAAIDAAGELRLFRTDYRIALWEEQPVCLPEAKRQETLTEEPAQAAAGYQQCRDLIKACQDSPTACQAALEKYSLYK